MKNNFLKLLPILFLLCLCTVIVHGCAVPAMQNGQMTFNPNHTDNGLIFGSITFPKSKPKFNGYFLGLGCISTDQATARNNSTEIHFSPEQIIRLKHKGQLDEGLTYLFAIERPAGSYEFSSMRFFENGVVVTREAYLKGFSIPIEVKKGEITYVGNIKCDEYRESDKIITYQNNFEKDLAGIKKAQPYVYWAAAKNDTTIHIAYRDN